MNLVTVTFDADEWQVVPKKATGVMCRAGQDEYGEEVFAAHQVISVYRDMLAAAPQPPVVSSEPVAWVNPTMLENPLNTQVITASLLRQSLQQVPLYLGPQPPVVSTEPAGITRFNPINAASNLRSDGTYLASQPSAEPVAWRYQDARGHYRYRGYVCGFDKEYPILKPIPLYLATQPNADAKEAEIILELKRLWFSDADPTETRYADEFAAMQRGGA